MKLFDKEDIEQLNETYDEGFLNNIDFNNFTKIYQYLISNGIYFAKDLVLEYLNIFVIDYNEFKNIFEKMKNELGKNYIVKLEDDITILNKYFNV